ncbi:alpha/beta hydrolase-fold protein [Nonlabens marinus]|uniref:Putative esterase n=1 Tax=Nonlabens marinus S1-08 TaxID=1454201 RepID=W8VZ71_9FLAO|nr:alpha/beta hydrolase-fold protein [Nonlabens marinus]BAO54066.1 putative esterase [Nonlabens marinus S1-08]
MNRDIKIAKGFRLLLAFCLTVFLQTAALSQSDHQSQFLQKLGVLDSLDSKILNETREIYVQLPDSYSPDSKQKYPVVYILDGKVLLPAVNAVQSFYSGGFTPEMVLVGIVTDKNRTRDLTTSTITTKYGMPFQQENGKAANFRSFLEKELIPFVEKTYPVTSYRTLVGHSYGSLFAVATLMELPDLFANYLAIDPSLDWDDQKLLKQAQRTLADRNLDGKALYVSLSGQLHMQNSQITIDNVMQDTTDFTLFPRSNMEFSNLVKANSQNGLAYSWKFYPKDIHGTVSFPSLMDGLISLFKWYQMEHTDKLNSFDTSKEELSNIITYREQKLKDHFGYSEAPYPKELMTMMGYMNLDMQEIEKSKMYFELAIKHYPKSADAYSSIADYYEAQDNAPDAIKSLNKAYELSGDIQYKNRVENLKIKYKK